MAVIIEGRLIYMNIEAAIIAIIDGTRIHFKFMAIIIEGRLMHLSSIAIIIGATPIPLNYVTTVKEDTRIYFKTMVLILAGIQLYFQPATIIQSMQTHLKFGATTLWAHIST
jgi:hypothetical protein